MFTNVHGEFMQDTSGSDSFHGQGHYGFKWNYYLDTGRDY